MPISSGTIGSARESMLVATSARISTRDFFKRSDEPSLKKTRVWSRSPEQATQCKQKAALAMHLAQINIGRVLGGPDDPRMKDFFANLARVNALAERMPGFVWRLKDATGVGAMGLLWPG